MTKNAGRTSGREHEEVSRWEWIVAAIGVVCFLFVVGYFGREAIRGEQGPADVVVRLDSVTRVSAGYLAHFEARNAGGSTAGTVHLEATLTVADSVVETSQTIVDYLAPASAKSGGFFFTRNPGEGTLRARASGYVNP